MHVECQCLQKRQGEGALTDTSGPIKPAREWTSISSEVSDSHESSIPHFHSPRQSQALSLLCSIYSGGICLCHTDVNVYT